MTKRIWLIFFSTVIAIKSFNINNIYAAVIDEVRFEGNKRIPDTRITPYLIKAGNEFDIKEFNEEPLSVFRYQLANTAQARPVSVNYAIASDQFATAVQNVLTGMDVKEALDQAVTQYNFQTDTE